MDLRDKNGKVISWSVLGDAVLKYHLSTSELMERRSLTFKNRDEFLEALHLGMASNEALFNKIKKALEKNDKQEEKKNMSTKKNETTKKTTKAKRPAKRTEKAHKATTTEDTMSQLIRKKESIMAEISETELKLRGDYSILKIREETLSETQYVFDKARKALEDAKADKNASQKEVTTTEKKLTSLKEQLEDTEKKIADKKASKIYLVAPNYTGDLPEFGTFVSTVAIAGVDTKLECASEEFRIKPEFEDMLNAGYDSGLEYANDLQFIALVAEYILEGREHTVLVSEGKISALMKTHIG